MDHSHDPNVGNKPTTLMGFPAPHVDPDQDTYARNSSRRPSGRSSLGPKALAQRKYLAHPVEPNESVDVGQLLTVLRQNVWGILCIALLIAVGVVAWTAASRMEFGASARLYLGELERATAAGQDIDLSGSGAGDMGSEIEIVKSRSLVDRAILESGLNVQLQAPKTRPVRYWQWRLSKRDPALLDVAAREVRAVNTSFLDPRRAKEQFTVRFDTAQDYELRSEQLVLGKGRLGEPLHAAGLSLTLQPGTAGTPAPGAEYELTVLPLAEVAESVLSQLDVWASKAAVGAEPVKVVNLRFSGESPRLAQDFLQRLMQAYLDERQVWKAADATAAQQFVTQQLESTRSTLDDLQKKLVEFRKSNPVVVLDTEAQAMITQIGKYEEQRVAARLDVAALSGIKRSLSNADAPVEAFMMGDTKDPVLMDMASSLSQTRQRLAAAEARFSEQAPEVKQEQAQVSAQLSAIRGYVNSRLSRAQESLGAIGGVIGQFESRLKTVPATEAGLAELTREAEVYNSMYSYLLKRQQETAIQRASTISKNRILDPAQASYREQSPVLLLRLATIPFGLLIGALVVFFRSWAGGKLHTDSDVRRLLGHPVFATVPSASKGLKGKSGQTSPFDLLGGHSSFNYIEAFRMLRTNLYYLAAAQRGQIVLITSPFPGDGKTTCTLSLAAMLAADGKSVLVIDTDLRKQSHSQLLGQAIGQDLQAVLAGTSDWRDVVRPVPLSSGEFYSIDAGGVAPAELLSSERMMALLREAREAYDYVLLDSPSYPLVSDALVLASAADCVLSVVRLEHTPQKLSVEHVRRLAASTENYGLVINGNDTRTPAYGSEYAHKELISAEGVAFSSWRPPTAPVPNENAWVGAKSTFSAAPSPRKSRTSWLKSTLLMVFLVALIGGVVFHRQLLHMLRDAQGTLSFNLGAQDSRPQAQR